MNNFLNPSNVSFTKEQQYVLDSEPNLIISGCPGTGKTLLAINLAIKRSNQNSIALIVFTKALRTFISDIIQLTTQNHIDVFYEREWENKKLKRYDIIIIDEFQDFSINDITRIMPFSKKGCYFFGDPEQKLYQKNLRKENALSLVELSKLTKFKIINLKVNFRVPNNIVKLLKSIYKYNPVGEAAGIPMNQIVQSSYQIKEIFPSSKIGDEIELRRMLNYEEQLNWITNFIKENVNYKNIGLLFKQNKKSKNGYFIDGKVYIEELPGILETFEFLTKEGIQCGYKYERNDRLDFSKQTNVNIMTIHSAKGLEFDCVIIPFYSFSNRNFSYNIPYVAFSRCSKKLIILYSGIVSEDLELADKKYLNGELRRLKASDSFDVGKIIYPENNKAELDELFKTQQTLDNFYSN